MGKWSSIPDGFEFIIVAERLKPLPLRVPHDNGLFNRLVEEVIGSFGIGPSRKTGGGGQWIKRRSYKTPPQRTSPVVGRGAVDTATHARARLVHAPLSGLHRFSGDQRAAGFEACGGEFVFDQVEETEQPEVGLL